MIEFKLDGTIMTANALSLSTVGYLLKEIEGKHDQRFMPPHEAKTLAYQAFQSSLTEKGFKQGEYCGMGGREKIYGFKRI